MTGVEKVLLEMEARGHHYFEDTLRIGRVVDLLNRARVQREFEERVVADAPQQIERRVTELIDWLVEQDFRAVAGGHRAARGTTARARRSHPRRPKSRQLHRGPRAAARLGRPRSAARRRHLRSAAGVARRLPMLRAAVGRGHRGGRRRRARARRHRRRRGDHGRGGRHRHPDGRRRGGARIPDSSLRGAGGRARRCARRWRLCASAWSRRCAPSSSAHRNGARCGYRTRSRRTRVSSARSKRVGTVSDSILRLSAAGSAVCPPVFTHPG